MVTPASLFEEASKPPKKKAASKKTAGKKSSGSSSRDPLRTAANKIQNDSTPEAMALKRRIDAIASRRINADTQAKFNRAQKDAEKLKSDVDAYKTKQRDGKKSRQKRSRTVNTKDCPPAKKDSGLDLSGATKPKGTGESVGEQGTQVYGSLRQAAQVIRRREDTRAESLRGRIDDLADQQSKLDDAAVNAQTRRSRQSNINKSVKALQDDISDYQEYQKGAARKANTAADIKKLTSDRPQQKTQAAGGRGGRGRLAFWRR